MDFVQAWKSMFSKYADFKGRAGRSEYWWVALPYGIFVAISMNASVTLMLVLYLVMLVPTLALATRRLHDTDRTGWWQLISIVPFVGLIVMLVFLCQEGTKGDNRYGPMPAYLSAAGGSSSSGDGQHKGVDQDVGSSGAQ